MLDNIRILATSEIPEIVFDCGSLSPENFINLITTYKDSFIYQTDNQFAEYKEFVDKEIESLSEVTATQSLDVSKYPKYRVSQTNVDCGFLCDVQDEQGVSYLLGHNFTLPLKESVERCKAEGLVVVLSKESEVVKQFIIENLKTEALMGELYSDEYCNLLASVLKTNIKTEILAVITPRNTLYILSGFPTLLNLLDDTEVTEIIVKCIPLCHFFVDLFFKNT